jgi:hypothetical protein
MCFKGDTSGPDIWLTIENGRYVPAPPMIYVPGLRQIQDRLHHKDHHTGSITTSVNNVARLPPNAIKPAYNPPSPMSMPLPDPSNTEPPPTISTQPPPETLAAEPDSSEVTKAATDVATSTLANEPVATVMPEALCQEPVEVPVKAPVKAPMKESVKEPASARRDAEADEPDNSILPNQWPPAPPDITASSPSSTTLSTPSDSCSSSLHSILKKSSTSTLEDTESEAEAVGVGKARPKVEKKGRKPKIQKSVSFAQDTTAPAPAPPLKSKEAAPVSAADEGSAIAKKLVEWMASSQKGLNASKGFHSAHGGEVPRQSNHASKNKGNAAYSVTDKLGVTARASGKGAWTNGAGSERVGKARMSQCVVPNKETDSYVDDEIPGKWP